MKIIKAPSPNYDERTLPVSLLVLHYTGMETGGGALERLCDEAAKVSAHYMVEEDGRVFGLVDEERRAWHAGVSSWGGETNINSVSIGIEIVNGGHDFGLPDFPKAQIDAVIELSLGIIKRHDISPLGVVAHSDIAPSRKQDPGEKFPWEALALQGVGYWPDAKSNDGRVLFEKDTQGNSVSVLQTGLAYLGYGLGVTGAMDEDTCLVIAALQRRYRPEKVDGQLDVQTMEILTLLADAKKKRS